MIDQGAAAVPRPAPDVKVPLKSWGMVAVLFGLYVFSWLDRLILSMLVGPIKADLVLSDFQISLILGPAFAVSYALFGLPIGWAVDRFARRIIIFCGVTTWACATVASGLVENFHGLLIARVCVGLGEAVLLPSAYSLIADEFPKQRLTLATSFFQMAGKVGSAAAFGLGGVAISFAGVLASGSLPVLSTHAPWQIVFFMVGAPGLVLGFLVFTFQEPARKDLSEAATTRGGDNVAAFLLANWRLMGLLVVTFSLLSICGYTLTSWVPTYISRAFGWAPIQYGPALSLMNLVAAASLVVNGRIVDHLFGRGVKDVHLRFYSWLMLATAPAVILLFIVKNAYVFLALYGVAQFVTVPFMIYASSIIALLAPNAVRGQLIALFLFAFTMLGLGAGPAMVGALTDFVFKSEARIGASMMVVILGCFTLAFIGMRVGLLMLGPAIRAAEGGSASQEGPGVAAH